jgi:hypothetical protein
MKSLLIGVLIVCSGLIAGCSTLGIPDRYCVNCDRYPLAYQGVIQDITQGVYIETACVTIKLPYETDFQIGDIIHVEYTLKKGDFCSEIDQSIYNVYKVAEGDGLDEEVHVHGSQIQLK